MLEYPELGMEAVWKIDVENFPAFIVVDGKGKLSSFDLLADTDRKTACVFCLVFEHEAIDRQDVHALERFFNAFTLRGDATHTAVS